MIIGLSGYMGSGKDTAGQIIQKFTQSVEARDDMGAGYIVRQFFHIKKFSAKLKELASLMLGIPVEKFEDQDFKKSKLGPEWSNMTVREFLQKLGTDAIRDKLHKDAWVNAAMAEYKESSNWIFTDVRFPNEAQAIKDRGGIIIRLNRYPPGCSPKLMDLHESEIGLDDWDFDYVIYNLGTLEDLENQIKEILTKINKINLVNT